jgi:hypothetical protein
MKGQEKHVRTAAWIVALIFYVAGPVRIEMGLAVLRARPLCLSERLLNSLCGYTASGFNKGNGARR